MSATLPFFVGSPLKESDIPPSVSAFDQTSIVNIPDTSFVAGSPEVGVNFIAPASGHVLVAVGAGVSGDTTQVTVSFELREINNAGTVRMSASNVTSAVSSTLLTAGAPNQTLSRLVIAPAIGDRLGTPGSRLTPGLPYHARVMHLASAGGNSDIDHRDIMVVPLPLGAAVQDEVISNLDNIPTREARSEEGTILNISDNLATPVFVAPATAAQVTFVAPNSGRVMTLVGGGIRDNTNSNVGAIALQIYEDNENGEEVLPINTGRNWQRWGWSSSGDTSTIYQYGCKAGFVDGLEPGRTYFAQTLLSAETVTSASVDVYNQKLAIVGIS